MKAFRAPLVSELAPKPAVLVLYVDGGCSSTVAFICLHQLRLGNTAEHSEDNILTQASSRIAQNISKTNLGFLKQIT